MSDVVAGVRQFIEAKSAGRHGETKVADDDSLFASGIIDSMGGHIGYRRANAGGSVFFFELPAMVAQT